MIIINTKTLFSVSVLISYFGIIMDCIPLDNMKENSSSIFNDVSSSCDKPICKNWELVTNVTIEDTLPVYKFRSKRTGMIIVLAEAESPIVNGYFCLSTEAFNNDGLPHTLEHLVFLGSEDYPYKEILDLMANRCLADRTNAWTDTDHTCYTVYTAGKEGFLSILPIYVDHILFPLLREDSFVTEIHHINGDGEDAGVVYSEMQAKENRPSTMLALKMSSLLYPGNSSYGIETGGKLKNLREITNQDIKEYHEKYYRPENFQMTITGQISPHELFQSLDKIESKIVQKRLPPPDGFGPPPELERPFIRDLESLNTSRKITMDYPSEDEKFGRVKMGWRLEGNLTTNIEKTTDLSILHSYLTSTSASPFTKSFVDIPKALATSVYFDVYMNWEPSVVADFYNVPVESMEEVEAKYNEVVQDIIDNQDINMERMHTIVRRMLLSNRIKLEESPYEVIPDATILDLLYSQDKTDFKELMSQSGTEDSARILSKTKNDWIELLNETLHTPKIVLLGYPSAKLNEDLLVNETERIENQAESLGPEKLQQAASTLEKAIESQELPPNDVLASVPVANVSSITYRKLTYYNYTTIGGWEFGDSYTELVPQNASLDSLFPSDVNDSNKPAVFNIKEIPFRFHFDDINSQFVRIFFFLDMSDITPEDRPYAVLLTQLWLDSPIKNGSNLISLDDVLQLRSTEALSFYNDLGYKGSTFIPGSQSHLQMFYVEAKMEKYESVVLLLKDALHNVEFTISRAKSMVSKLLNRIPAKKQTASTVVNSLYDNIYFNNQTFIHSASFLRQANFLRDVMEKLEATPATVLAALQRIRKTVVRPKNVFVQMSTSLSKLTEQYGKGVANVWKHFFDPLSNQEKNLGGKMVEILSQRYSVKSESEYRDANPELRHVITGLPGTESCYLKQAIDYDTTNWEMQEVASVRLMLQYLADRMYEQIRGQGFTYSVGISVSVTEGRIKVFFSKASQLINAYKEFRKIISNYSTNSQEWDPILLDSAKGSLIYNWVEIEETPEGLAAASVLSYLRKTDDSFYARRFVKRLAEVTIQDVQEVADKYLSVFFNPNQTHSAIVCGPGEVESIKELFSGLDPPFHLEEITDLENSILTE